MTYNPSIPLASDLISVSQQNIEDNFTQLNTQFAIDHTAFNTGSGNGDGFHKKITVPTPLGVDPTPIGTSSSIYTKSIVQFGLASAVQAFFANSGSAFSTTSVDQITGPQLKNANGYMVLPGGILVKWGSFSGSSGVNTFTYPTGATIPVFNSVYQVFLQPTAAPGSPNYFGYIQTFTATNFVYDSVARLSASGATGSYSYFAIGS